MKHGKQDTSPLSELLIWLHVVLTPWTDGLKTACLFCFFFFSLKNCLILVSLQQSSEFLSSNLILIDKWGGGEKKGNKKMQIHKINVAQ